MGVALSFQGTVAIPGTVELWKRASGRSIPDVSNLEHGRVLIFPTPQTALGATFAARFPGIHATAMRAGIDPRTAPIPVTPAAHYTIGGIATDVDGRTSLPGLLACGEAAATGLHGANRLASNSLVEGLVFGARVGRALSGIAPEVIETASTPGAD